jgi:hypothetical protein
VRYLTLIKKPTPPETTNQTFPANIPTQQNQPTTSPTPEATSSTLTPKDETIN